MDRIIRGLELTRTSGRILLSDKKLLLFTVLSAVCTLIAAAMILLPVALAARHSEQTSYVGLPLLRLFILNLVTSFISLFFNTALAAVVLARLDGIDLTVGEGFSVAFEHLGSILVLAAIHASIGLLIRALGRRFGLGGAIAGLLFGAAWGIATFLVVPIMVVEGGDPLSAIGRSIALIKKTWGEDVTSAVGIGAVQVLLSLPALAIGLRGLFAHDMTTTVVCISIAAVYLVLLGLVVATLEQIVRSAVYYYAETGTVPEGFDRATMREALSKD